MQKREQWGYWGRTLPDTLGYLKKELFTYYIFYRLVIITSVKK